MSAALAMAGDGLLVRIAAGPAAQQQLQCSSYALGLPPQRERELLSGISAELRRGESASCDILAAQVRERQDPGCGVTRKLAHLPTGAQRVLALGCGAGAELQALRARYPQAELVATDQRDQRDPARTPLDDVEFVVGDMHALLGGRLRDFDLVFSHHVLEHSYEPERTLSCLLAALKPGGCCYAVLPLEGEPGNPLWPQQRRLAGVGAIHPVDVSVLDPGHPWKPSVADLLRTARACGFARLELGMVLAPGPFSATRRVLAQWLHHLTLRPLRALLRRWPAARFPRSLRHALCGLDARLPFGAARLKNRYCPEVVLRAWR